MKDLIFARNFPAISYDGSDIQANITVGMPYEKEDKSAANKIYRKIKKEAINLQTYPEKFRVVPELYDSGIISYREIIATPYRIIYKVTDQTIIIIAVIDSRQDLETFIFGRILR